MSIVGQNDHAPQLLRAKLPLTAFEEAQHFHHEIHLVEHGERVLYPSLLPWIDLDGGVQSFGFSLRRALP
uniref:Uncharacterized protein n=1 Tax=Ditylenchus dipsaci TaxID=166011 RepID=A0A915DY17_9BILA